MFSSNTSQVSNDANYIEDVFSTWLYSGDTAGYIFASSGVSITTGGMMWVKSRGSATNNYIFSPSLTNANYYLNTNTTAAQSNSGVTNNNFEALDNGGGMRFGGAYSGISSSATGPFTSWTFRKQPKFFDVVTYTGTGATQNISHNLGSVPGCIIVKRTDSTSTWPVYHVSVGASKYLTLNTTNTETISSIYWNNTAPTSTQFTVGSSSVSNASGGTYVAYLFAHNAGGFGLTGTDNVIMCGSYAGTGNTSLNVNLGFEPQWVMIKNSTTNALATGWYIQDNMRGMTASTDNNGVLYANLSNAEAQKGSHIVPTATGFTCSASDADFNDSGTTYIYIAIRRGPMKVPTSGTTVFNPYTYTATGTSGRILTSASAPNADVVFQFNRAAGCGVVDRLRGFKTELGTYDSGGESPATYGITSINDTSIYQNNTGGFYVAWNFGSQTYVSETFARAPSFMDVVCYTGTGTARTLNHNLGVVPEMMIVKKRNNSGDWPVYQAALGATKMIELNSAGASSVSSTRWNDTAPTASVFTVGTHTSVNASGDTYVAYLFATCAGVSKVGSYTGTGTTKQIDCGFTSGSRFVMIKRTDSPAVGDWYVWDSARGIVSGNDPYKILNSSTAEVTNTDYVDTYSAGFEISSTAPAEINASGGTFIFFAVA